MLAHFVSVSQLLLDGLCSAPNTHSGTRHHCILLSHLATAQQPVTPLSTMRLLLFYQGPVRCESSTVSSGTGALLELGQTALTAHWVATSLGPKTAPCLQCRRPGFNPWVGRSPGKGNGNPLQYSCLGNPMDRRTWQATVHRVAKSQHSWVTNTSTFQDSPARALSPQSFTDQLLQPLILILPARKWLETVEQVPIIHTPLSSFIPNHSRKHTKSVFLPLPHNPKPFYIRSIYVCILTVQ